MLIIEEPSVFLQGRPPSDLMQAVLNEMEDTFGWDSSTECPISFFQREKERDRHWSENTGRVASRWHCEISTSTALLWCVWVCRGKLLCYTQNSRALCSCPSHFTIWSILSSAKTRAAQLVKLQLVWKRTEETCEKDPFNNPSSVQNVCRENVYKEKPALEE